MTREESIAILDGFKHNPLFNEQHFEALDMAISALSAEPCREADDYENEIADLHNRLDIAEYDKERYKEEITILESENKGDLISRQAVLDGIDKYIEKAQSTGTIDDFNSFAELVVKTLPSVENKGEWIADVDKWGDVVTTVNGYTCSKCGMFNSDKDNFCPNCGSDMRGE